MNKLCSKMLLLMKALWYGKAGEAWWNYTDSICGRNATVSERLENTRDFL